MARALAKIRWVFVNAKRFVFVRYKNLLLYNFNLTFLFVIFLAYVIQLEGGT